MTFSFRKIAVVTAVLASFGLAGQAQAGIFLVLRDAAGDTLTQFSAGNTATLTGSIDGFTNVTVNATTNAPGGGSGFLTTTLTATPGNTPPLSDLTLSAFVANSANPNDLTLFTSPSGTPLFLSSNLVNSGGSNNVIDKSTFSSVAIGRGTAGSPGTEVVDVVTAPIPGTASSMTTFAAGTGFFLQNQTVLDAVTAGSAPVTVTGTSTVTAMAPEPGTMVAALTGLLFVGGFGLRRRSK